MEENQLEASLNATDGEKLSDQPKKEDGIDNPNSGKEDVTSKKDYFRVYGEMMKYKKWFEELKGEVQTLKSSIPAQEEVYEGDYDKDQVQFVERLAEKKAVKIAEQKFNELFKQREQSELQHREEKEFLKANPEAVEYLESIYNFKKNVDPNISLNQAWKWLSRMYWVSNDVTTPPPANMGGAGTISKPNTKELPIWDAYSQRLGLSK